MDAVITYVNMSDPLWQKDYQSTGSSLTSKRFRDWGTLKYLLRGIEENLPFVENVYLVVSRESQVPSWTRQTNLRIVCHRDIIPEEFLPVFNSTAIEMFLHRIPGLSEQFLYFNDDMFPLLPCSEEDFFPEGKIAVGFSRHLLASGLYKKQTRNADRLARQALGLRPGVLFLRPQHVPSPMLRSASEAAFQAKEKEILASVTPLRAPQNLNQYYFLDYLYHSGRALNRRLSNRHFSLAATTPSALREFLQHPTHKFTCINDVHLHETQAELLKKAMLEGFEARFPRPSRFERDSDER